MVGSGWKIGKGQLASEDWLASDFLPPSSSLASLSSSLGERGRLANGVMESPREKGSAELAPRLMVSETTRRKEPGANAGHGVEVPGT